MLISNSSQDTIGGSSLSDRNVIAANLGNGVQLFGAGATDNLVQGNLIGVVPQPVSNPTTYLVRGNAFEGVFINGANFNRIQDNTISGNGTNGVEIFGIVSSQVPSNTPPDLIMIDPNTGQGVSLSGTGNVLLGNKISNRMVSSHSHPNVIRTTISSVMATAWMVCSSTRPLSTTSAHHKQISVSTSASEPPTSFQTTVAMGSP